MFVELILAVHFRDNRVHRLSPLVHTVNIATKRLAFLNLSISKANYCFCSGVAGFLITTFTAFGQRDFEVYVPAGHDQTHQFPLIIFLDPAARAALPIDLYKPLADKFGIILAASNQSRNRALDKSKSSTKEILSTLVGEYSVDRNHIILCGFSGGGRASYAIANEDSRVTGVISCGAGLLGQMNINLLKKISYVGISGIHDMNFSEQYFLHQRIVNEGGQSKLITTDDGHDWPKLFHMEEAVHRLLQTQATVETKVFEDSIISDHVGKGNLYTALLHANNLYDQAWSTLPSFTGITSGQMRQDSIKFVGILKADEDYANDFFNHAQRSMLPMGSEMITNGFWDKRAREVKLRINSKDWYTARSGQRQYDISWRYCAEFFLPVMEQENYQGAFALAAIWHSFDPDSSIPFVMKAKASAAQGDRRQTIKMLTRAIKLGFSNRENLIQDPWLKKVLKVEDIESLYEKREQ